MIAQINGVRNIALTRPQALATRTPKPKNNVLIQPANTIAKDNTANAHAMKIYVAIEDLSTSIAISIPDIFVVALLNFAVYLEVSAEEITDAIIPESAIINAKYG